MAVFISVTTDPFEEVFEDNQQRQPQLNVRRPLRGIQIKEDTYAVLRVLTSTGKELPLLDSSSPEVTDGIGRSTAYSNFIIQQFQETRVEKQQIVETFGEDYIFFFGERPRFIQVSGVLMNTKDFNWKSEFWSNYENYLRGTKLVEQNARLYLYFDDVVIEGYLIQAATTHQAGTPYHLPFQFQMFVCNYAILSTVGSVFFQEGADQVIEESGLVAPDPESQRAWAENAARLGAGGGLFSFLATTQGFSLSADFGIGSTLENIRNTFFGRQLVVPRGIGNQLSVSPIQNLASFQPAPVNRPIHEMFDEYVNLAEVRKPTFDDAERLRVNQELALRTPFLLEEHARAFLVSQGIDPTRRETEYLLLGRAAFAGAQVIGSFGVAQADGAINAAGQAPLL